MGMYRKQLARVGSNGQGLQAVGRNSKRRAGKEISRQGRIATERDRERWGGIDGSEREQ